MGRNIDLMVATLLALLGATEIPATARAEPRAQPLLAAAARAAATGDKAQGKPFHVSGVWVLADTFLDKQDGRDVSTPGRLSETDPKEVAVFMQSPQLKGEYEARRLQTQALMKQGKPVDDMGAMCLPPGMPAFWMGPYAFEILQTPSQINISQEWDEQTRRIYLDGRPHPQDYDPSYNGHSIGHWEGGELVVDTVGVREDTKIGGEMDSHHSDAMHIVERIRQISPDMLHVQMTVYDEKAFKQPWVSVYRLRYKPGMEMEEYVCEENNRNAVDASGVTRSGLVPK